jgi:transposase
MALWGAAEAGLAVELLETRHVKTALSTMPVKTDRNDARGIAQLSGWAGSARCTASRWPPRKCAPC